MQTVIHDEEFGEITIRTNAKSRGIQAKVNTDGRLVVITSPRTPKFLVKKFLSSARSDIAQMVKSATINQPLYESGDRIGKSHSLVLKPGEEFNAKRIKQTIYITYPKSEQASSAPVQQYVRDNIRKALRKEAKHYLPRRLESLANKLDASYERVRISHAGSRWGSCSSSGTISLNIALMLLPFELIDYVLIHELAHTFEMNHSSRFWNIVAEYDPEYLQHRKILKKHSPIV